MGTAERALRSLQVKPSHNLLLDFVPSRAGRVTRRALLPGPAPHPQPQPSSHSDSPTPWKNTKGKTPSSRSSSRSLSISVQGCRGVERCRGGWSRGAECPGRVRTDCACVRVRGGRALWTEPPWAVGRSFLLTPARGCFTAKWAQEMIPQDQPPWTLTRTNVPGATPVPLRLLSNQWGT